MKISRQIDFGRDPTGKRIRKRISANSQNEFYQKVKEYEEELSRIKNPSAVLFKDYSVKWLETYKAHKAINTYNGYKYAIQKCSELDMLQIRNIKKSDLQKIINDNREKNETCRKIALTLKQIFESAMDDGIIAQSPAAKLDVPRKKAKEKRALTDTERRAIKEADLSDSDKMFLDLLYYCGIRRGEALALTRSDFDFKSLSLIINKSIAFDGEKPILKDTKTHKSRYVPIPQSKVKDWQKTLKNLPFSLFRRDQITKTKFRTMWNRIEKSINTELGAKDGLRILHITPHMIRHDFATRLYYIEGISTKMKAEMLGHQEEVFLRIYSHLDLQKESLKKYQEAMNF